MDSAASRPRLLAVAGRALRLRCPACGRGALFGSALRMAASCPACGLSWEREAGYFVGAIYLNYGITVALALAGYFVLEGWLAPPVGWQLGLWSTFGVLFPLWFYRYSKALWLGLDYYVDPGRAR